MQELHPHLNYTSPAWAKNLISRKTPNYTVKKKKKKLHFLSRQIIILLFLKENVTCCIMVTIIIAEQRKRVDDKTEFGGTEPCMLLPTILSLSLYIHATIIFSHISRYSFHSPIMLTSYKPVTAVSAVLCDG